MVMSEQHHLTVPLQVSYRSLNKFTERTKRVWVVFHGYGQLTEYFLKKFEVLNPDENFVVAPQGLSKFYLDGFSGRVGATWMTKEDRLTEIDNQQAYINAVLKKALIRKPSELILFGFSQGVSTMCRFATHNHVDFQKMVLWAGTFPPEITKDDITHWRKDLALNYYSGTKDPFLKEGMVEALEERIYAVTGKKVTTTYFEGKHEIQEELLLQI